MSYEKDLSYLRKEFKKSEDKFREAEREGYETDADMWQNDMMNIGHQIHIHEQASKADEYEAKARAFDRINQLTIDQVEHEQTYDEAYRKIDRVVSKLIEDIGTYESEAE